MFVSLRVLWYNSFEVNNMTRRKNNQDYEDCKPIKFCPDYFVVQANELVRSKQPAMTLIEAKFLRTVIAQIIQRDKMFFTYSCKLSDLAEFLEIPLPDAYRTFKDISDKLMKRYIYIPKGTFDRKGRPNYRMFQWVAQAEYEDGVCKVKLSNELKPYLLELNALFTQYNLESILALPTVYSLRLYELLCSYQNMLAKGGYENPTSIPLEEDEFIFSLEYLRELFDCENKYPNSGDFMKRTVVPAVEAINKHTIMRVSYRKNCYGKRILHVIFKIA